MNKREELILKFKEAMCKYTFFYKKVSPEEIYFAIIASEKALESSLALIKILEDEKKQEWIDYINPSSDVIIVHLEHNEIRFVFEIENTTGEISLRKIIKNNFNFKTAEEAKEIINTI